MKNKILGSIFTASTMLAMMPTALAWNVGDVDPIPPTADMLSKITDILGYAQWIGFVVAVVMCIWVGVKYITAGAGDKAKVKDTLIPMLIGAALVALAPVIAQAIFSAFKAD